MKLLTVAALVGPAAAFAPAEPASSRASSLAATLTPAQVDFFAIDEAAAAAEAAPAEPRALIDEAFGISIETGNKCPPLGRLILQDVNAAGVKWWQNAELKHGRVAMVGIIGYMVQKYGVHFPLYLGPSGSNVFHPESSKDWLLSPTAGVTFSDIARADPLDSVGMIPAAGWAQIILAAGLFEATAWQRQWAVENPIPGDYGYDPLGFTKREGGFDSAEIKKLRMMEIKNGRVAMLALAGWLSNESVPGALPLWHP